MKSAAERKALQRRGIKSYRVSLPTNTIIAPLIVGGFLMEHQADDDDAIGDALARFFYEHLNRFSIQWRSKAEVVRARAESNRSCLATAQEVAAELEEELRQSEAAGIHQATLNAKAHLASKRQREIEEAKAAEDRRKLIENLPVQVVKKRSWQDLGQSGIRKRGGKPITNGFGRSTWRRSQADDLEPMRPLKSKELERLEAPYGPFEKDRTSPHLHQLDIERWEQSSFATGIAKAKPKVRQIQHDDGTRKKGSDVQ